MGITLYIGGQSSTIQGEKQDLGGYRCFTAAYTRSYPETPTAIGLLDSGAFSDSPDKRLTLEAALLRQLRWETSASKKLGTSWISHAIASYDLLIDEVWTGDNRVKRRWSVTDASFAVHQTVEAAKYLASQRQYLQPRHLVLGCQGVDVRQYRYCIEQVLKYAQAGDWIGLGGWCILGRRASWLPVFFETLHQCIPLIATSPVKHVHIYGVMLDKALAPLLWMCDRFGLTASCDSSRPILDCTRPDPQRAGVKHPYWRSNVRWWQNYLAAMRGSKFYREPERLHEQLSIFDLGEFYVPRLRSR